MKRKLLMPAIFVVTIILIQIGFIKLEKEVDKFNNTEVEITITDGLSDHKDVTVDMAMTKFWVDHDEENNILRGAQYDGAIKNTGKFNFHSWKVILYMSEEGKIDSLWNGEYVCEGDAITLTPMDYNGVVESEKDQTFGFVCLSKNILEFNTIKLFGYFEMGIKDLSFYWILLYIRYAWIIALISYIIVTICLIGYKRRQKRDEKIILQVIDTFISFIDAKDPYTSGHSQRVAIYTKEIAKRMGLDDDEIRNYFYIALMHDCGKLMVPDTILKKPGALTKEERKVIESHTLVGADLLKNMTAISGIQDGALHHHEKFDGTGYPNKLKGKDISLVGRILCVADAYDAMNSDRCYRDKLPIEKIKSELTDNAGKQFDPDIVKYMLDMIDDGVADKLVRNS
ncbi:MAG: HD domain-containing protein [Lachnospiraceae bacterium]|nr:HD domain-containing protein [Lachnospiraceae bacterium]